MKRVWLACSCLGLAASSLQATPRALPSHPRELRFDSARFEVPDAERFRHVLSNGVVVYIVEDHTLPLVDLAVALRAGEFLDAPTRPGVAGLTAALLTRGGTDRLSPAELDGRLEHLALDLSTVAGNIRAGATLNCTTSVLPEALELFFEVLTKPRFDVARLDLAKGNLLESFKQRNDDPLAILDRRWRALLFGDDHFLSRQLTAEKLAQIGRDDLLAFHRRYWHPGAMVVAVAGDVDTRAMVGELERRFSTWPAGEKPAWPPPAPTQKVLPGLYHVERGTSQGKVFVGHRSFQRAGWDDREAFAALVMSELLGGRGPSSRISGRVRTVEGLAYRAGATFGVGDHFPGEFRIQLESKNESVALATKLALEEVERLRRQRPSEEELETIKSSIVDGFPYLFDSAEEVAGYFAEDEYLGRPHGYWRDYRKNIERVSAEDVRAVAEKFLRPDEMVILLVGKWGEIEPGDPARRASMRDFYQGAVVHLPLLDPLTLEPLP